MDHGWRDASHVEQAKQKRRYGQHSQSYRSQCQSCAADQGAPRFVSAFQAGHHLHAYAHRCLHHGSRGQQVIEGLHSMPLGLAFLAPRHVLVQEGTIGVVETAKRWGVTGKGSEVLAFVVAFFFVGLAFAIQQGMIPEVALPWIVLVVTALAGGLTATGYYDLLKRTGIFDAKR